MSNMSNVQSSHRSEKKTDFSNLTQSASYWYIFASFPQLLSSQCSSFLFVFQLWRRYFFGLGYSVWRNAIRKTKMIGEIGTFEFSIIDLPQASIEWYCSEVFCIDKIQFLSVVPYDSIVCFHSQFSLSTILIHLRIWKFIAFQPPHPSPHSAPWAAREFQSRHKL